MSVGPSIKAGNCEYQYQHIEQQSRDIRIVILLPGNRDDDIRCVTQIVSLDASPAYEAISYAWGDPQDTMPILLDGHRLIVMKSLESAMRHLRQPHCPLHVWADALCIDQQNTDEKNHQVSMMGDIYSAASRVYIWLGKPDPMFYKPWWRKCVHKRKRKASCSQALRSILPLHQSKRPKEERTPKSYDPFILVNHFADDKHLHELPCYQFSAIRGEYRFRKSQRFKGLWQGFMEAAQSSWWSRLWCVQEALLARDALVIFGQWTIPWKRFNAAAVNRQRHQLSCCAEVAMKIPLRFSYSKDNLIIETHNPNDTYSNGDARKSFELDWLIRRYRHKDCQDPRDKVYGILGLVDRCKYPDLVPDYSLSVEDVFINVMKQVIAHSSGDLQCLTGSGFNSQQLKIPSWVRDLSSELEQSVAFQEIKWSEAYPLYNASANSTSVTDSHSRKELRLHGFRIDTVGKVGSAMQRRSYKHAGRVLKNWHRVAGIKVSAPVSFSQNPVQQAFWRTIVGDCYLDCIHNWQRLTAQELYSYERWVRGIICAWTYKSKPRLNDVFVRAILAATFARAMFITVGGHIGLCDPRTRAGDEVWIVNGGRVPFIFRPLERSVHGNTPCYMFIGESYLNGFMDGEAVADDAEKKAGEVVLI